MNLVSVHSYGHYADDGFGNLVRLELGSLVAGFYYIYENR